MTIVMLIISGLMAIFIIVVWCVASIPIHELFHVLCIRLLRGKGRLKIVWIDRRICGSVSWNKLIFPAFLKKHPKLLAFLLGVSGGLGESTIAGIIGALLYIYCNNNFVLIGFCLPFLILSGAFLVGGVLEGIDCFKKVSA